MRYIPLLAAGLACTACLDFDDPTIPDPSSPVIVQANMRIFDIGIFQVDGSLTPGRDAAGVLRLVQIPFIQAGQFVVEPRTLNERGVRSYISSFEVPRGATEGPFELRLPDVRGTPMMPVVRWWGLSRPDGDTLVVAPGGDVVLRMDTVPAPSDPPNRSRQWFLDIRTGATIFRISSDGAPPPVLRIPSEWAPGRHGERSDISLIYYQSAQLRAPDNSYIANIVLDTRLTWVVLFRDPDE